MTFDLTEIFVTLIGLTSLVFTIVIKPYIESKITSENWNTVKEWVYTAVNAFETIYIGAGRGEEKKQAVKEFVENLCERKGIDIDVDVIDVAIQDAWDSLGFNKGKTT